VEVTYTVLFDYTIMNEVMMVVKQCKCSVLAQESQLFCRLELGIPKNRLDEAIYRLKEIRGVTVEKA
jgi:hypothetical protein